MAGDDATKRSDLGAWEGFPRSGVNVHGKTSDSRSLRNDRQQQM
jgi:hypothetical protein